MFALIAPACILYPHDAVKVPAVEGRLLLNDLPVADAVVRYSADANAEDCDPEHGRAVTSFDGRFRFKGTSVREWVQMLPPFLCESGRMICIKTPDGRKVHWSEGARGFCSQPAQVDLVCDIAPDRIDRDTACVAAEDYEREMW
ncbi:MAG: hypothetical protein Q8Q14_13455 [Gemmatimonadales bacterium]|nr:hypothetical protein [Gemmatimonadales bacterium]